MSRPAPPVAGPRLGAFFAPALLLLLAAAALWWGRDELRLALPDEAARATRIEPGGDVFPKRLLDPSGRVARLATPPRRIASATLASDEILLALVGPELLVGVTRFVDDPHLSADAGRAPAELVRIEARAETLLPLAPDLLVVANYTRAETAHLMASAGVPLLRLGTFGSFEDVFANILRLGEATGSAARAEPWVAGLRERVAAVERRRRGGSRPRVLYLAGAAYSAGRGSLVDDLLTRAGAHNVARDVDLRGSAPLSTELAIALQPDIVLVTGWSPQHGAATADALRRDPRWREVPAVRDGRVHALDGASLLSVTHHVVDALEAVERLLHDPAAAHPGDAG